jgi:hypothetical protein
VKTLSVCQPWAWALIHSGKRIENRTWRTDYRGPLLIHASRSMKWDLPVLPDGTPVPEGLPRGVLVGVVELVDCVPYDAASSDPFALPGHWCWRVTSPRPVDPVPWKGRLQLFDVPMPVIRFL